MKLDEMKVQYERSRDGFERETDFRIASDPPPVKVDASGIVIKIGLCIAVLALAVVVRAFGIGKTDDRVAETSTHAEQEPPEGEESTDAIGTLHYVEAGTVRKWSAPVVSNDMELLRDGQLLRFTALTATVNACMAGEVLSVGEDDRLGSFVRIRSDNDCETIYYGFETVAVKEKNEIGAGDLLGTVAPGRSIYLRILREGAPQDPTAYIDLSLKNE